MNAIFFQNKNRVSSEKGYVTLITVLIVSAIAFGITFGVLSSGVTSARKSSIDVSSAKARAAAITCVERALYAVSHTETSESEHSYTLDGSRCSYTTLQNQTRIHIIQAIGYSGTATIRIQATLDTTSYQMRISSWNESAVF